MSNSRRNGNSAWHFFKNPTLRYWVYIHKRATQSPWHVQLYKKKPSQNFGCIQNALHSAAEPDVAALIWLHKSVLLSPSSFIIHGYVARLRCVISPQAVCSSPIPAVLFPGQNNFTLHLGKCAGRVGWSLFFYNNIHEDSTRPRCLLLHPGQTQPADGKYEATTRQQRCLQTKSQTFKPKTTWRKFFDADE